MWMSMRWMHRRRHRCRPVTRPTNTRHVCMCLGEFFPWIRESFSLRSSKSHLHAKIVTQSTKQTNYGKCAKCWASRQRRRIFDSLESGRYGQRVSNKWLLTQREDESQQSQIIYIWTLKNRTIHLRHGRPASNITTLPCRIAQLLSLFAPHLQVVFSSESCAAGRSDRSRIA